MAILLTIGGRSYIEINDEAAGIATTGQKPFQITKPITALTDAEVLELIYTPTKPPKFAPQSREIAPAVNDATPTPTAQYTGRKRRIRRLGANGYAILNEAASTLCAIGASNKPSINSPPLVAPDELSPLVVSNEFSLTLQAKLRSWHDTHT